MIQYLKFTVKYLYAYYIISACYFTRDLIDTS